jgi:alcohol dehydrogenase class IV
MYDNNLKKTTKGVTIMFKDFFYFVPVKVVFGQGKLNETGNYAKQYGKKALIVTTGTFFKDNGLVGRLQKILKDSGVASEYFPDVSPNPLCTQVENGVKFAKAAKCDVFIGLGGGSAIDAAKAMAYGVGNNEPIWPCWIGQKPMGDKTMPIIAISTTSGTGSHVTPYSVITNPDTKEKPGMGNDSTYAKVAIVDPELMLSIPPSITAATGFDILAHCIEAYTSNQSTPMTDLFCEQALRLVGKYLRQAVKKGKDIEARNALAYADTLAGFSISVAVITLCHAMAHSVGGVCETTHGESLAAMTPQTMRFSMSALPEKYKHIGLFLLDECIEKEDWQPEDSVKEVEKLIKDIGMYKPLRQQGVKESDFEAIADGTLRYMAGAVKLDPREATKADILDVLKKSF